MKKGFFLVLCSMLLFSRFGQTREEESLPQPSLENLIQKALEANPEIQAAKAEWEAEKQHVWIDTALEDPIAGYDLMGSDRETLVGPEAQRFVVYQQIPFPLKLYQKGKAASAKAKSKEFRYEAMKKEVTRFVKKYYYDLYLVDASIDVIEEIQQVLKSIETSARSRYATLAGGQRDVVKAQIEIGITLEKISRLNQQRQSVVAALNALLNQPPLTPLGKAKQPRKPVFQQSLQEVVSITAKRRSEIKEMEAAVSESLHRKKLAKLSYIPDLNIGFEYTVVDNSTTTQRDDGKDIWMIPLRINIPLWQNRIIPEITEARKKVASAEAALTRTRNQAFLEVKETFHKFETAKELTALYETSILPKTEIALSSDRAGYKAGKASFLDLLDSERLYLEAKISHLQYFTEMLKSHADLERAMGF